VKQAMLQDPASAKKAIWQELLQIIDKGVFVPLVWDTMSSKRQSRALRSFLFLKQKYTAAGVIDKLKARLVANGKQQDRSEYTDEEISAPTASVTSLYSVAAIAAAERRVVRTVDFKGAYLHGNMPEGTVIDMIIDPILSKVICDERPEYRTYLRKDGAMAVNLARPLYGTLEAARIWYNLLTGFLGDEGFVKNDYDRCVWNRGAGDDQITIVIYVDDLFITGKDVVGIDALLNQAKERFGDVTVHEGPRVDYLGMVFDFSIVDELTIQMTAYEEGCCKVMGVTKSSTTPASEMLFKIDNSLELLGESGQTKFHSFVAKLLYLAKRARPDILCAVSFLTTRVKKATDEDFEKLMKVGAYLNGSKGFGIRFTGAGKSVDSIKAMMDAAFGVHFDFKSQTGIVIMLFDGPIDVQSTKQKCVTKSSHEAELVAASDGGSKAIWCRRFLEGQGYVMPPTLVGQDNMATIASLLKGAPTGDRSRHVNIRNFWLQQEVENKELSIEYVPTTEMIADCLTKPLQGELFVKMRRLLLNWV
jgi:hypothetical protein